ncbi:MAG: 30S ribosomal protein S20 [Planctomycetaceae bacterium]|jgi:small subunit ribosomal protein S20|nr:30S ribosomal protein S20 [Planctomycetaceae bacterium]
MPNTPSAKKRLRQDDVISKRNRSWRSAIRNRCKKVVAAINASNLEQAEAFYKDAVRILDRAGAKKLIHKNAAARKKSRLTAMIKKLKGAGQTQTTS